MRSSVSPALLVEVTALSLLSGADENYFSICVRVSFCIFTVYILVYVFIFIPVTYCFDYYSFVINFILKSGIGILQLGSFLKICLGYFVGDEGVF